MVEDTRSPSAIRTSASSAKVLHLVRGEETPSRIHRMRREVETKWTRVSAAMRWAIVHDASRGRRIGAASAELRPNRPRLAGFPLLERARRVREDRLRRRRRPPLAQALWHRMLPQPARPPSWRRLRSRGSTLEAKSSKLSKGAPPLPPLDQGLHRFLANALQSAEGRPYPLPSSTVKEAPSWR